MPLKTYLKDPMVLCLVAGIVINAGAWLVAIYLFPTQRSAAILHYNTTVGIDFIGAGSQITVIPLIGSALILANILLAFLLKRVSKQASALFWAPLPLIQVILLGALVLILRLNT